MSAEAMWYASYVDGRPPKCVRLSRLPWHQKMGMAFTLARARRSGDALSRPTWISTTRETYWHWPIDRGEKKGPWWMVPPLTVKLSEQVAAYAMAQAQRPPAPIDRRRWPDDPLPPSLRRSPRSPIDYDGRIDVELRRLERRANHAARAMEGREPPEWRKRTPKETKIAKSLRPDVAGLRSAAWLRSMRARASERYERAVPAMIYHAALVDRDEPRRSSSFSSAGTPPPSRRRRDWMDDLPSLLRHIDKRLREGEPSWRLAAKIGVSAERLRSLIWLIRVYGQRLYT